MPHSELIYKLKKYFGIDEKLLKWICSFLSGRRQRVKIGDSFSEWAEVTSGVPQGSVLAPLLFLCYVKDMQEKQHKANVSKFADDTKLFSAIYDSNCTLQLQASLDAISEWCKKWKMPLNLNKSAVLKFERVEHAIPAYTLQGEPLRFVKDERDLGIKMDSMLSFKPHIQDIVAKSLKLYGWMVRTLVTRERDVVLKIYKTIIRPNLEYASSFWNPTAAGQIKLLEKVQRKVTKLILGKNLKYNENLQIQNLPTLKWRRHSWIF